MGSNVWDYFRAGILHSRDLWLFKILASQKIKLKRLADVFNSFLVVFGK